MDYLVTIEQGRQDMKKGIIDRSGTCASTGYENHRQFIGNTEFFAGSGFLDKHIFKAGWVAADRYSLMQRFWKIGVCFVVNDGNLIGEAGKHLEG